MDLLRPFSAGLSAVVLSCLAPALVAQTTAFNDTFTGASTVNANPTSPASPSVTAASYQQIAVKTFSPAPPVITSGNLRTGIVSTSSGFTHVQALFTQYPVTLVNTTDYLELTVVFSTESGIITASSNSTLMFGLLNAGQVQPIPGGMNGTGANATAGYAQNWQGYVNRIFYTGGSNGFFTRPAKLATDANNQDVLYNYGSGATVGSTPASTLAAFVANATYTEVYRITKASATTLTLSSSLYSGATATGSPLYTQSVTSTSILTAVYDAFAIGWRCVSSTASIMNIKSVKIRTTGTTTIIPEILSQPLSVTKMIGENLTLSVTADGGTGTALSYQWKKGGAPIGGAPNSPSFSIPSVALADAGDYSVTVTDVAGSTTSSVATLTVTSGAVAPSITVNPTGSTILVGGTWTFSATVNGSAPITYQWQQSTDGGANYSDVVGATGASFTISSATIGNAGLYRLVATNSQGSASSTGAALIVNQAPVISSQPVGGSINVGGSLTLSVTATGTPAPTYQWRMNGTNIPGATSSSYLISSATGAATANYTVVITNAVSSVTSAAASVAVLSATMAQTALTSGSTLNPDTRLTITFNEAPTAGVSGFLRIYDASTNVVVDSIDLVAATTLRDTLRASSTLSTQLLPVQTKPIGGIATNFNYYPVTIAGNTATIYPRNGVLAYNKTYYVKVDAGVFVNSSGLSFPGISDTTTWRFSTKTSGPAVGTTSLTVAADGSGDYVTLQAALDFIPANNTTPTTIFVKNGTYFEEVGFQSKHNVTVLGEDSTLTIIAYPNNNTFNNVSGVYHRATFLAQSVHDFTLANLTISNTTPQNGSQAEAIVLNGTSATVGHNLITRCKFFSYQDTVQFNKQTYISDSTIVGDVDFMWGDGPAFFKNCDIRMLRTGGYFSQIRNGNTAHGFVFVGCRFTAPAGITGTFLGRIDPTAGNFPFSEVVILDSTFGDATNNAFLATASGVSGSNYLGGWWLLNNVASASSATSVHNWDDSNLDANGAAFTNPNSDLFTTMPTDATTQANYRNATWVLNTNLAGTVTGSWTPSLAPVIAVAPTSQTVNAGNSVTFTVTAFAIPSATYQWRKNGVDIPGATNSSYTIASAAPSDADTYTVFISNSVGSVTSSAFTLLVNGGPPVITVEPLSQSAFAGTGVSFSVFSLGTGPFTYQWSKAGVPIGGATGQSLLLSNVQPADAASYTVTVSNANGFDTSTAATLALVAPNVGFGVTPTLPTIPTTVFKVTDYGAIGDGTTDNTVAIAATITAAKNAGGGIVEFSPAASAYLSGPIAVSSNINLQIDGGATLKALPYGTYPNPTTHFITFASGSSNIAITGTGTIDGNGSPWWTAYDAGLITSRPRLIQFTKATNVLITGVTFKNSPNFNLAFSGVNSNVTIFGASVIAPGDSPNTDGMDLAGTNFLVQNCYVSVGDDNIVAKPGSAFCRNIVIADCSFGTGHGVSIGGQTNVGLDGMLVTNCSFNGTSSALRMKADPTQGGPVTNVTFSNITMVNVTYPILFYSYYNQLGSPGATSGSSQITPAKAQAWNVTPPNSLASTTLPSWSNITISNLTSTSTTGYSTIWGLPLASGLISNVTLNNVNITGGAGLELYNATGVQITGSTSVGPYVTCNALAITGQPQSQTVAAGGTTTFTVTAVGTSGVGGTAPTYQWNFNGTPLANGAQPDGTVIAGATTATLTLTNTKISRAGSYTATVSNNLDGYNVATSALVANSLPVSATSSPATLTITDPYLTFIAASGLSYSGNGAPSADPEGDGVPNQIEYLLGLNPLAPDSGGLPTGTSESGNFVFRFVHQKTATAAFTVQQSTDLLAWSTLSTAIESSTATTETLVATLPLSATKQFVRLTSEGVSTVPVGFLKIELPTAASTVFGLPLDDTSPTPIGQRAAKIESFTATTITRSAGGWTGNLANPAAPWALRLTSGPSAGKLLDITANTATTLTLSGADLTTLGLTAGTDTFELVPLDTLASLFSGVLLGGTTAGVADNVQVRSGTSWLVYFYDTNLGFWRRTIGPATNANNVIVRPATGVQILRRGPATTLTFLGRVLGTTFRTPINNASTTVIHSGFPMDTTLGSLAVQTLLSGWTSTDTVSLYSGTAWVGYSYNGANWQPAAGGANSDATAIPAGALLTIQRPGATAGTTDLVRVLPYSP